MKKGKIAVSPYIDPAAADWYQTAFGTRNSGATFTLNVFPALYRKALSEMKDMFCRSELNFITVVMDGMMGTVLLGKSAGDIVAHRVMDYYSDHADTSPCDRSEFCYKLANLDRFKSVCLEIWAIGFWMAEEKDRDAHLNLLISKGV